MMRLILVVHVLSLLLFTACPSTGIVCMAGTSRCGNGCADYQIDNRNCGGCGQACLGSQQCTNGACLCRSGTQLCEGACVVIESDPRNCGACGSRCATGEVCENKTCRSDCSPGTTRCGFSCVTVATDSNNCGACGTACPDQQSCHNGSCQYDLVAACFSTGQVVGVRSGDDVRGPLKPLGSGPISLGQYGQLLLAADSIDNRVLQARLPGLDRLSEFNTTGRAVNQILVDAPRVYAVNSVGHTVQVLAPVGDAGCPPVPQPDAGCAVVALADGGSALPLMGDGGCFYPAVTDGGCASSLLEDGGLGPFELEDAGCFVPPRPPPPAPMPCFQAGADGGLQLVTIGEVDTGANTYPQGLAKSGNALFVPLYGGLSADFAAGQKVLRVDISNPAMPTVTGTVDLTTLDLKSFDGGVAIARPYPGVEHGGSIYVPLNNFDVNYSPAGPGFLAVINPTTLALTSIDLGTQCLNPVAISSHQGRLFISCGGAAVYDSNFALVGTSSSGVLALDPVTMRRAMWSPQCPPGGDGGCMGILPSRLAVRDGRLYLGDQNGGRIFVADLLADGGISERRGYANGAPIQACGIGPFGYSNVADVLVIP